MRPFPDLGRRLLRTAAVGAGLLVAGCGFFGTEAPRPCPTVSVLKDAAELIRYRPGPGRDLIDVIEHAKVAGIADVCEYNDDSLEVELAIDLVVERGPAAQSSFVELPYFIAVLDAGGAILAKEVFTGRVEFPADRRRIAIREETEQIIPLDGFQSGANFEILVGFQLTREELEEIRRRNR